MTYFVTGATGFLGKNLLRNLLRKRHGPIHILVRQESLAKIGDLVDWLEEHTRGVSGIDERIVPVVGDVGLAACGVSDEDLGRVGDVEHFFHLAAVYDIQAGQEESERANVAGTRHALELAARLKAGCFHHTSSIAVAGRHKGVFTEEMFDEGQSLPGPYFRTKFDAEAVVRDEAALPWRVYRPGIVVGDSRTGETDKVDGPYYFFKLIQRIRGVLPQWAPLVGPLGSRVNIVPVDFVTAAMEHIAHKPGLDGRAFHLVDPEPLYTGDAMNAFMTAAHAPRFAVKLDRRITNPIKMVTGMIGNLPSIGNVRGRLWESIGIPAAAMDYAEWRADFDCRNTLAALGDSDIECPPLPRYAGVIWDYWERNLDPDLHTERSLRARLEGRVVVVTGASSGIGEAVARACAGHGATVLLVARTVEKLEATKARIEADGGQAELYSCDLTDMDSIEETAGRILSDHGRVDVLVNNAGRSIRRSVALSFDRFHDYERTMQLNYFGALKMIMSFLPTMIAQRNGHIVNISSIGVQTNPPRFSAYVASKSALDAFSRVCAAEVAADGVEFTEIYMPLVRTPMIAPTTMYKAFPTLTPDEAADMVLDAIRRRPKKIATRVGNFGELLYFLLPKTADVVLAEAYRMFPESARAKGEKGDRDEDVSGEGVAFARLMRGIHF